MTNLELFLLIIVFIQFVLFFWRIHTVRNLESEIKLLKSSVDYWFDKYDN